MFFPICKSMSKTKKLMAILAHPDDESLGTGGALVKYASEGVETYLICATRGEKGRFDRTGISPGLEVVGKAREAELLEAAKYLKLKKVFFLDYLDQELDQADPVTIIRSIAAIICRVKPQVLITFGPDGAYGHPDHIAISQFATSAAMYAGSMNSNKDNPGKFHQISKLYYIAWPASKWNIYQSAFKQMTSMVDGVKRQVIPWPDWEITTVIDTRTYWKDVWNAIQCHKTQMSMYDKMESLEDKDHENLWGSQEYYRVFSLVNGGRQIEKDLFEGL